MDLSWTSNCRAATLIPCSATSFDANDSNLSSLLAVNTSLDPSFANSSAHAAPAKKQKQLSQQFLQSKADSQWHIPIPALAPVLDVKFKQI